MTSRHSLSAFLYLSYFLIEASLSSYFGSLVKLSSAYTFKLRINIQNYVTKTQSIPTKLLIKDSQKIICCSYLDMRLNNLELCQIERLFRFYK